MNNQESLHPAAGANAGDGVAFEVSNVDHVLIRSIVARAFRDANLRAALHFIEEGEADARLTLTMDITAAHANGCPIALARLLDADDADFGHDVTGIQRHIDRRTGKLRHGFCPRLAMNADERKGRQEAIDKATAQMKDLLSAAEHAGATRVHLDYAKQREAEGERRRKAANARRRKARNAAKKAPATSSKSSHSPRAAGRGRNRRPGRR